MDESGSGLMEKNVYVALPERWKDGKSTLSWALNHFSKDTKIIITHVHITTPIMGTDSPASQSSSHQFNRKEELQKAMEWDKAQKHLKEYLPQCSKAKFKAEIVMFASHDVAHGLIELISLYSMSHLVMGTASDKWLSRGMTGAKSNTTNIVMEKAHPSCKIWVICKGTLVCTRAPALQQTQVLGHRSGVASSIASEGEYNNYDLRSMNGDDDLEARSFHEPHLGSQVSKPACDQGTVMDVCAKLQAALADAAKYRVELNEETSKREKSDKDLAFLIQKVEETKNVLLEEKQEMELLHKLEIETVKCQLQEENKKLQEERDNAVRVVKALHEGAAHGSFVSFSEYSLSELQQATDNFSDSCMIGEGSFGCVYKGLLHNSMVAIKMLHPQTIEGRFEQEVAVLSTIRHPNLVNLIGACSERPALVYEFLPNGNLEDRLACQGGTPPLAWQVRMLIIGEICRALLFLHSNNPNSIVHGNLKPTNILLDANLVSKVTDFGFSCLLIESNASTLMHHTKNPRETLAYMDPEYLCNGEMTIKSDVYSFGIIVLQLLTGKGTLNIATHVKNAIETDSLHLLIDKSAGDWPFIQAEQLAELGLRCAQVQRRMRPDLESEWKLVESLMKAASLSVLPSFKSELDDKGTPSYFMCPIFQEVMKDPHIAADGYTYEAEAIKGWIDSGHATSPMTNLPLAHLKLTPNHALRSAIQEWLVQRSQW